MVDTAMVATTIVDIAMVGAIMLDGRQYNG